MLGQLLLLAQVAVVCHPTDSFRPLVEEIARGEGVAVAGSWNEAKGDYLIWVVEPGRLSDRVLVSFARAWRDRFPQTAVGLISGRTPEQARALWSWTPHGDSYQCGFMVVPDTVLLRLLERPPQGRTGSTTPGFRRSILAPTNSSWSITLKAPWFCGCDV